MRSLRTKTKPNTAAIGLLLGNGGSGYSLGLHQVSWQSLWTWGLLEHLEREAIAFAHEIMVA